MKAGGGGADRFGKLRQERHVYSGGGHLSLTPRFSEVPGARRKTQPFQRFSSTHCSLSLARHKHAATLRDIHPFGHSALGIHWSLDIGSLDIGSLGIGSLGIGSLDIGSLGIRRRSSRAFTLLELLIVLAIIGLVTALALPHLKGLTRSNVMAAANQQLLDDVALARQRAINGRSVVCMVFMPPIDNTNPNLYSSLNQTQKNQMLAWQYTAYTMFAERTVGDQPGRPFKRYLSSWKHLPDGVFIATDKFSNAYQMTNGNGVVKDVFPFLYKDFPYPTSDNTSTNFFPYIAFDPQGHLTMFDQGKGRFVAYNTNCIIPLARGSIFLERDGTGALTWEPASPRESGGNNSRDPNTYDQIEIDSVTGRALLDRKSL